MIVVYRRSRNTSLNTKMHPLCQYGAGVFLDCPYQNLDEQETHDPLALCRCCLMGKRAVSTAKIRTAENAENFQKDSYQLGILTLNLGHINRMPYIGGSTRFPPWVRIRMQTIVFCHICETIWFSSKHSLFGMSPHGIEFEVSNS